MALALNPAPRSGRGQTDSTPGERTRDLRVHRPQVQARLGCVRTGQLTGGNGATPDRRQTQRHELLETKDMGAQPPRPQAGRGTGTGRGGASCVIREGGTCANGPREL